jgi:predicted PurR-regulated permease PerM
MSPQGPDEPSDRATDGLDPAAVLRSLGLDRQRLALWAVTGVVLLGLWGFAWRFVGTLVVGLFVYYVCRPVFARIHARVDNRTVAVAVTLVTIALPTLALVGWTVAILVVAITDFLGSAESERLAAYLQPYLGAAAEFGSLDQVVRRIAADPRGFTEELGPLLTDAARGFIGVLATLGGIGLQAFIVLVIAFYLLRDDVRIAAWARTTLAPGGSIVETYLVRVDRDLERIFFGNILNALLTGLIAVVSYLLLNTIAPTVVRIPEPTLVGILVGVSSLVPAIGIKLVTWPLGFYLLARAALLDPPSVWFPGVFFLVSFVVVDYIPDQLLRPYVSGRGLHVGAVMLAYLFGPLLFGWYGIFLGPLLLAVVFEFGRVVVPWLTGPERAVGHAADGPDPAHVGEPAPQGSAPEDGSAAGSSDDDGLPADADADEAAPDRPDDVDGGIDD